MVDFYLKQVYEYFMDKNYFKEKLRNGGLKATPQRLIILEVIKNYGHIDIEEICSRVQKVLPSISVATIYKNLKTLMEAGIVEEVDLKNFKPLYEIKENEHIHLVCKNCKSIKDIFFSKNELQKTFENIVNKDIDDIDVIIYYNCEKCQK